MAALPVFLAQSPALLARLASAPAGPARRSARPGARATPWDRGRPARLNTGGPSAHGGRDARDPRKGATPSIERGYRAPVCNRGPSEPGSGAKTAAASGHANSHALGHARSNAPQPPWDRGRPARPGPQARPTATAAPCLAKRTAEPTPGIAGVPPAPGRRPGQQRQPHHAWPNAPRSPPGIAGVPPAPGRRPGQQRQPRHARSHAPRSPPWDRGRPARPGRRPAMDNPPQARPTATAASCLVEPIAEPTPGIAGVPPAPAGGRQWTTRRRPTGLSKRSRRPSRPRRHLQLPGASPFLGSRASRPPWAAGPPDCPSGQGAPRAHADTSSFPERRLSWDRGRPARRGPQAHRFVQAVKAPLAPAPAPPACRSAAFPGIAGVPPAVGRRPTGLSKRSRRPSRPRRHLQLAGAPSLGSRASRRLWAKGPPVCPSGQGALRAHAGTSSLPERLSWDRGRPARLWAAGPPVCPSGQGAPRALSTPPACRSAFPGIAGVPPAVGRRPTGLPKRSRRTSRPRRHLQLAGAPFLGSRASRPPRPEAGNGQPAEGPPVFQRAERPRSRGLHPPIASKRETNRETNRVGGPGTVPVGRPGQCGAPVRGVSGPADQGGYRRRHVREERAGRWPASAMPDGVADRPDGATHVRVDGATRGGRSGDKGACEAPTRGGAAMRRKV